MDFMTAAKTGFSKLGDMSGRASRSEFWWYVLAVVIVMIIVNVALASVLGIIGSVIGQLIGLALLFAATIRRMNDAGKPVIVAYIYYAISLIVGVAPLIGPLAALLVPLSLVGLVLLIVMIFFLVQPSTS